jgi:hypothetical protein
MYMPLAVLAGPLAVVKILSFDKLERAVVARYNHLTYSYELIKLLLLLLQLFKFVVKAQPIP